MKTETKPKPKLPKIPAAPESRAPALAVKGIRAFGMELDPHYCDVIRKRWAEFVHGDGCDWQTLAPEVDA